MIETYHTHPMPITDDKFYWMSAMKFCWIRGPDDPFCMEIQWCVRQLGYPGICEFIKENFC